MPNGSVANEKYVSNCPGFDTQLSLTPVANLRSDIVENSTEVHVNKTRHIWL
jgi:hypothetical protein